MGAANLRTPWSLAAPVALRPFRAPHCPVDPAAAGPGEQVMGCRRIPPSWPGSASAIAAATVWQMLKSAGWAPLAGVPAVARTRAVALDFHRRSLQRREDLRPGGNRAWHQPRSGSRRHRAPAPGLGRAADTELAHGAGRCRDAGEVVLHLNQQHLMIVLRGYADLYNTHRPRRPTARPRRCIHCPTALQIWPVPGFRLRLDLKAMRVSDPVISARSNATPRQLNAASP